MAAAKAAIFFVAISSECDVSLAQAGQNADRMFDECRLSPHRFIRFARHLLPAKLRRDPHSRKRWLVRIVMRAKMSTSGWTKMRLLARLRPCPLDFRMGPGRSF